MKSDDWCVSLDADRTWRCEHRDAAGNAAPPTRLSLQQARVENPDASARNRRHRLRCPDCGTEWRAWESLARARPYADRMPDAPAYRYRRTPVRDIDRIIAAVRERFPEVSVTQYQPSWPADDDGVWWFGLPGAAGDVVQVESGSGNAPFAVETDDARPNARTLEEAVHSICEHIAGGLRVPPP